MYFYGIFRADVLINTARIPVKQEKVSSRPTETM